MTIKEAISARHMVRKYTGKPLSQDIVEKLNVRIDEMNEKHGVCMKLVLNNSNGIWMFMRLFCAKAVKNYLVLAGEDKPDVEATLGYCGADIALYAQTLGLNSWWVGDTYNRGAASKSVGEAVTTGIIALGYGETQGVPHKSKSVSDVSAYDGDTPEWFTEGVKAALLAPTAMNKQNFKLLGEGHQVSISCNNGRYTDTDLGIVKYHFEIGAGKENFIWI